MTIHRKNFFRSCTNKLVSCLLCLSLIRLPALAADAGNHNPLPASAPTIDVYVPCERVERYWTVNTPIEPLLRAVGMELDLSDVETENLLEWQGNRYVLTVVEPGVDLFKTPFQTRQSPLPDGTYKSSIFPEAPYRNGSLIGGLWSITMEAMEVSNYCGSAAEIGPYYTVARIIDGVLYYPDEALGLLLSDFGFHEEWIDACSCYHIWSFTSEDYPASTWAIPEIMYSVENGLTLFPTEFVQHSSSLYTYSKEINWKFFLDLLQNTYYHIYGHYPPEEDILQLAPESELLWNSITREEALLILAQTFSAVLAETEQTSNTIFADEVSFASSEHLTSARLLCQRGILKGVPGPDGYYAQPQSMLTGEQAISLCVRIYQAGLKNREAKADSGSKILCNSGISR